MLFFLSPFSLSSSPSCGNPCPVLGSRVSVNPSESMLARTLSNLGFYFYFMCMRVSACTYVCTLCACSHREGQKMALDPLGLVVTDSCELHICAETQTWMGSSAKAVSALTRRVVSPGPR